MASRMLISELAGASFWHSVDPPARITSHAALAAALSRATLFGALQRQQLTLRNHLDHASKIVRMSPSNGSRGTWRKRFWRPTRLVLIDETGPRLH
jgi:hypothetical protein